MRMGSGVGHAGSTACQEFHRVWFPGRAVQTVNRAELGAFIMGLRYFGVEPTFYYDSSYVCKGYRGPQWLLAGTDADLWYLQWSALGGQRPTLRKVKAHTVEEALWEGAITPFEREGSRLDDVSVGEGAKLEVVLVGTMQNLWDIDRMAMRVVARMLEVTKTCLVGRQRTVVTAKPRKKVNLSMKRERLCDLGHQISSEGLSLRCGVCQVAYRPGRRAAWISQGACPGPPMVEKRGRPAIDHRVLPKQLAKAQLHPSHTFGYYRGIMWCWKCGAYGTTKPLYLTKPCKPLPEFAVLE